MKLGLYSDIARQNIEQARQLIVKKKYKSKFQDIIKFRKEIIKENKDESIKKISHRLDFYSTSGVRDLLFNVQEHRFTLPQLSEIMFNFNLEFLGFSDKNVKKKYSKLYSADKKNILLDNWHKFEIDNTDAFSSMYAPIQFESQLMRSPDEINIPIQGKELPESMTGKQGGKTLNIIMVYAPWCGWSKKALPDFDRLIRDYNGKTMNGTLVQVIKYDSEVDTEMVKKYDVEGFPSFIMEKVTTKTTTEEINERTYDGLVSIIKKNV